MNTPSGGYMPKGLYIVIEGLDGSGKTTQFERVKTYFGVKAIGVREPGGTPMSESIRGLLKDKDIPRAAHTNMFLFSAARADLVDTIIRPTVAQGNLVLSDRNWLSTVAYQSAEGADIDDILRLSKLATGEFFEPDLLLLIDVDPATCRKRLQARGGNEADYFDNKGEDYFTKVRNAYLQHVQQLQNGHVIDGTAEPDEVWQRIRLVLDEKGLKEA